MRRVQISSPTSLALPAGINLLVSIGDIRIGSPDGDVQLRRMDAVLAEDTENSLPLLPDLPCEVFWIGINFLAAP
jgi:hypothetical protein